MTSGRIILDCGLLGEPDGATIDRIARLQLAVRRSGCELRLRNPNCRLLDLIGFVGLAEVLCVESERQPEQGEQLGRVEEEGELDNPPA